MEIEEYSDKYCEDVKDLLVELEEYIVSIDKDNLDTVSKDYREKMIAYDLDDLKNNQGICYLAIKDNHAIGLIMGKIVSFSEVDKLDYKCPKEGRITELIISKKARRAGIGNLLMEKMTQYFRKMNCEYILVDVFAYNDKAIKFYSKNGYHSRMNTMIRKIS